MMGPVETKALPIEPGDLIRLNKTAAKWTRGKTFTVDEVRSWGVICWWWDEGRQGWAFYRAPWDEIEGPAETESSISGASPSSAG